MAGSRPPDPDYRLRVIDSIVWTGLDDPNGVGDDLLLNANTCDTLKRALLGRRYLRRPSDLGESDLVLVASEPLGASPDTSSRFCKAAC